MVFGKPGVAKKHQRLMFSAESIGVLLLFRMDKSICRCVASLGINRQPLPKGYGTARLMFANGTLNLE
jgi:hypothetical protein